jgi:hypothetical protein
VITHDVPTAPVAVSAAPTTEHEAVLPLSVTAYVIVPVVDPPEAVREYELTNPFVAADVIVKVACVPKVMVTDAELVVAALA